MTDTSDTLALLVAALRDAADAISAVREELSDLRQDNAGLRVLVAELNTQLAISKLQGSR